MDKELRDRLHWLTEELTEEEEPEYIAPPRRRLSRAEKTERRKLDALDPIEERSAPVVKKKGIRGLVFLAILEVVGILLILGWWLQWLM